MGYSVCKAEELKTGQMKAVSIENKAIVVVRSQEGELYALRNVCPHKGPARSDG